MPTELVNLWNTYFLPVGRCLGLMSSALKAAKYNSQGAAEYECGPVKIIGIRNSSNNFKVHLLLWYDALSNKIIVSFLQSYFS